MLIFKIQFSFSFFDFDFSFYLLLFHVDCEWFCVCDIYFVFVGWVVR